TVIAVFILYGNVLLLTGGGEAFFDLAKAVGGRMVGGAAQIATIASAFFGMINGSAVANVATTGNFTIPLMKRLRYETNFAGAVEAVASSGGQFSPPVMGAGAFIMAELLAKPYVQIARAAALPSFLFYVAVMASIYFWARLRRLSPVPRDEIPSWGTALHPLRLVPLVVPVIILLYFLVRGYTAGLAAFWAIVATAVLHVAFALGRERRLSALPEAVAAMGRALREGALSLVPVVMIVAAAQVIVMAINTTGFGTKFAQLIIDIGGQNVLLALVLAMVITTIMGMGAPTPAAYVLVAAVVGPALIRLGLPELPSHLFLYSWRIHHNPPPTPTR
ncbi:MAG: TRAP transporter fused permease subunit, partial [Clostridia bacterium]|nr:TRAP transporter fused permease subunit [Clostridia bacterium]